MLRLANAVKLFFCVLCLSCSESSLVGGNPVDDIEFQAQLARTQRLNVLLVLDNSCSMQLDWGRLNYGLIKIPEDLASLEGLDWKLGMITADPHDGFFLELKGFMRLNNYSDYGWAMVEALEKLKIEGAEGESGFSSVLSARDSHPAFFYAETALMLLFVTDEEEQSPMSGIEFLSELHRELSVVAIEPPELFRSNDCTSPAESKFKSITENRIDICNVGHYTLLDYLDY